IVEIDAATFEGGGDTIWHPGLARIWLGHGFRSTPDAAAALAAVFDAEVVPLRLRDERFYHLDTCLCPVDEGTAIVFPGAFAPEELETIARRFPRLVEADGGEARRGMACNAAAFLGRHVVLSSGCPKTERTLRDLGYLVTAVDTSEFLRSGGGVYCMKQGVF
ncbi:MAG: dimethylarginine dimethylaminohydrolase family protein, partial [Planctomycetota bacterium]